ncbi:MAG: UDP-N-acetyl-D-glucosamine 2-epimerase, UDP-hydrolyzing [Bacteroidetes bacterium]|nr:UDP-N-acetyl-D-glucosamine 2-epimerase, UDP-hydrolyzing [Bacteroidota bacterium]
MRVAILTSSRADYGIYKPLIRALYADDFFQTAIIAFGTHLSAYHGQTMNAIEQDGYKVDYRIASMLLTDDDASISTAMGLTTIRFADFWQAHAAEFDIVFCLGDRYEMCAAVVAGLSFGVKFAHLHGGETTLGAIDNVFRHTITMASHLHFVATDVFAKRVYTLLDDQQANVTVTGALSLDNLSSLPLLNKGEFKDKWNIDLDIPSILITIHPETVGAGQNIIHLQEVLGALETLASKYQLVITMPNADTNGSVFRQAFQTLGQANSEKIKLIENFGTQSYFSCMQHASMLLGNTSSGIIEAASFNKYVINLGDRQKGRLVGSNVLHVPFSKTAILEAVNHAAKAGPYTGENIYFKGGAAERIIHTLKQL